MQRVAAVTGHVESGVSLVNETGSALETIISRVSTVTASISTIAETAGEQSLALRRISKAISAMDQMTQQNAAMVEETNAATKNLTQDTAQQRLRELQDRWGTATWASPAIAAPGTHPAACAPDAPGRLHPRSRCRPWQPSNRQRLGRFLERHLISLLLIWRR